MVPDWSDPEPALPRAEQGATGIGKRVLDWPYCGPWQGQAAEPSSWGPQAFSQHLLPPVMPYRDVPTSWGQVSTGAKCSPEHLTQWP